LEQDSDLAHFLVIVGFCNNFTIETLVKVAIMPDWQSADQTITDLQLLVAAQSGDADAYGQLYARHGEAIFRFIYAHVDDRLDAEDLTEDVFLRVWRTLPSYREQGVPFVAYLFRVARNAVTDHYRQIKRTDVPLSLEDDLLRDSRPEPADIVAGNFEREELRSLLGQLRDDYRTVLLLRFLGDLSPEETAGVMGKSAGAVRVLQHRALAALRGLIQP
jgi:RNA polymerase sigma-70 factor (ECF subfamily)